MQELRLVAVSEDGSYLVLATAGRGTRFTLPVDDRLRAAVRGHFSRLGQFEIEVESPLRPKEIQARIRAGETAEEIAESAGIPVERVRWFEGPVLQEREYMAQQAQRVVARRQGDASPGPPLGEMVEERLSRRGVDLEEVEWDSWKCEDSTWRVRLSFFDDGRPHAAEWVFDPRRRQVSPLDEEAARLSSLVLEEPVAPTVTPLVPRRPAMKIVSDSRSDVAAEQRREYGADRGRAEPRRQSVAPHRREYVAPQEPEIVAATRERHVSEPAAPDVDAVAQATGVYTRETEPQGRPDHGPQTSSATMTESERERPAAEALETLRPVVTEVVTELVPEAEHRERVAAATESVTTGSVTEPATSASITSASVSKEPVSPDSLTTESAATEAVTVPATVEPAASELDTAESAITESPAAEPVPEAAEKARTQPAPRVPKPAPRAAAKPAPAPADPMAAETEETQETEAEKARGEKARAQQAAAERAEAEETEAEKAEAEEAEKAEEAKVPPAPKRKVPVPAPTSPVEPPARPGRRKNSARGKRASVPSWDEIMFGARRPD
jgi:hypothetical protein